MKIEAQAKKMVFLEKNYVYGYQTCQGGSIQWEASFHKDTWSFDQVVQWFRFLLYDL